MAKMWGNPSTKQFRHQNIRIVREAGIKVLVHKELAENAKALILKSLAEGWALPDELESWQAPDSDNPSPRDYGLVIKAPTVLMAQYAEKHGWKILDAENWIGWTSTPEAAHAAVDAMELDRLAERVTLTPPGDWETRPPGYRELEEGDRGDDVQFFQLAVGCPVETGVFDGETVKYADAYNHRAHTGGGGRVTMGTWKLMTRMRETSLERGDNGFQVRVLQAALKAYDWGEVRVTGRFDMDTHAAVVDLQQAAGLRATGKVRRGEWAVLFRPDIML